MTRQGAIDHIVRLSEQVAGEFCVTRAEQDSLDRETDEALRTFGVTDEELR